MATSEKGTEAPMVSSLVVLAKERPPVKKHLDRLTKVAGIWQHHHDKTTGECACKVYDELCEYFVAEGEAAKLDELGDVVVNALRALSTLKENELEFLTLVMEMKLRRTDGGVKDKKIEGEITAKLAERLL